MSDWTLYVTPAELSTITQEILGVRRRHQDRIEDPANRPAASRPIRVLAMWLALGIWAVGHRALLVAETPVFAIAGACPARGRPAQLRTSGSGRRSRAGG
jgi:hypothetical protein